MRKLFLPISNAFNSNQHLLHVCLVYLFQHTHFEGYDDATPQLSRSIAKNILLFSNGSLWIMVHIKRTHN